MTALAVAALIATIWVLTFERVTHEHDDAVKDVVRQSNNLAMAFEERTLRAVQSADRAALALKRQYERYGTIADVKGDGGRADSHLKDATVADAGGQVLLPDGTRGPVNIADREYFVFHRAHALGGLHISAPVSGRVGGGPAILFTRRLDKADGSFGGVVVISMQPGYFLNTYEDSTSERQG
jgi:two-component system, NarL family, sensor histidine kinase BarA